jgi:hypothetical protein
VIIIRIITALALITIFLSCTIALKASFTSHGSYTASSDPTLSMNPASLTLQTLGQTFIMNVTIQNVVDLYGLDIQLKWNPSIIHCVSHQTMIPVETYPGGVLHSPIVPVKDQVDESGSMSGSAPGTTYWLAVGSMAPASAFNGNGIIVTMTFKAIANGTTTINFNSFTLSDLGGNPISTTTQTCTVSVMIPPPTILWTKTIPTCPAPLVITNSSTPRQGEPILVETNISNQPSTQPVNIQYSVNNGNPWESAMYGPYAVGTYIIVIPSEQANDSISITITTYDYSGNPITSTLQPFTVKYLLPGDINGDGKVSLSDLQILAKNYGKSVTP